MNLSICFLPGEQQPDRGWEPTEPLQAEGGRPVLSLRGQVLHQHVSVCPPEWTGAVSGYGGVHRGILLSRRSGHVSIFVAVYRFLMFAIHVYLLKVLHMFSSYEVDRCKSNEGV